MNVDFSILYPSGNPVLLVRSAVAPEVRAHLAKVLRSPGYANVEEVGFLSDQSGVDKRVDMMGGELSIDGVVCASALLMEQEQRSQLRIACSGEQRDQFFQCVNTLEEGPYAIHTTISQKMARECERLEGEQVILVRLQGIAVILQFAPLVGTDELRKQYAEQAFNAVARKYGSKLEPYTAYAVVLWQLNDGVYEVHPVVCVKGQDPPVVHETACGSASIALALSTKGDSAISVRQPSGVVQGVQVRGDEVSVSSTVSIRAHGTAYIDV